MNILYVTGMWSGLKDIIIDGEEPRGMPAFINPLERLIRENHQVDMIVGTSEFNKKVNENRGFLDKSNIHLIPWGTSGRTPILLWKTYKKIYSLAKKGNYDFIYVHGSFGTIGSWVARKLKVPSGHRLYGTFLMNEINNNKLSVIRRHPLEYLAFRLKKDFLLITNDGTQGDKVYKKIGKKDGFNFYYWINGVNKLTIKENQPNIGNSRFILYAARITEWKQQEKAVELLKYIHDAGYKDINLILVGHISDNGYWEYLQDLIVQFNLKENVKYLSTVSQEELFEYYRESIAVLSFYKYSNLGNVVIEALLNGAIVIANNDDSLNGIINNNENGFLIDNLHEAQNIIINLLCREEEKVRVKRNATSYANSLFESWDTRTQKEIDLIKTAVEKNG
ncbi:glycosyltransferase [Virgibacillus xinjiangensis]|uniref:Glycosyltransferase n=1 Tax=Virgibacillus xinjiangensis TaxID=393090 RepID=A0ABV7CUN1_9BACI